MIATDNVKRDKNIHVSERWTLTPCFSQNTRDALQHASPVVEISE